MAAEEGPEEYNYVSSSNDVHISRVDSLLPEDDIDVDNQRSILHGIFEESNRLLSDHLIEVKSRLKNSHDKKIYNLKENYELEILEKDETISRLREELGEKTHDYITLKENDEITLQETIKISNQQKDALSHELHVEKSSRESERRDFLEKVDSLTEQLKEKDLERETLIIFLRDEHEKDIERWKAKITEEVDNVTKEVQTFQNVIINVV